MTGFQNQLLVCSCDLSGNADNGIVFPSPLLPDDVVVGLLLDLAIVPGGTDVTTAAALLTTSVYAHTTPPNATDVAAIQNGHPLLSGLTVPVQVTAYDTVEDKLYGGIQVTIPLIYIADSSRRYFALNLHGPTSSNLKGFAALKILRPGVASGG